MGSECEAAGVRADRLAALEQEEGGVGKTLQGTRHCRGGPRHLTHLLEVEGEEREEQKGSPGF